MDNEPNSSRFPLLDLNPSGPSELIASKAADKVVAKMSENSIDSITGLPTANKLNSEKERLENQRHPNFSVVNVDLNHLKTVNDIFGHQMGDKYLQEIARLLKSSCRSGDICVRNGGDEFTIILPDTPKEGAEKFLDRLNSHYGQVDNQTLPLPLTFSVGFAVYNQPDLTSKSGPDQADMVKNQVNETFKQADESMYRHKNTNREQTNSQLIDCLKPISQSSDLDLAKRATNAIVRLEMEMVNY